MDEEPLKGTRPWQDWELLVLRLIRQLPRDNPVRQAAERFLFDHGSGPSSVLRTDAEPAASGSPFVREKCGGQKAHFRFKGYHCLRCD